jgi:uncharacterized protein YfeS
MMDLEQKAKEFRKTLPNGPISSWEDAYQFAAAFAQQQITEVEGKLQSVTLKSGRRIWETSKIASPFEDGWTDGVTRWNTVWEAIGDSKWQHESN